MCLNKLKMMHLLFFETKEKLLVSKLAANFISQFHQGRQREKDWSCFKDLIRELRNHI